MELPESPEKGQLFIQKEYINGKFNKLTVLTFCKKSREGYLLIDKNTDTLHAISKDCWAPVRGWRITPYEYVKYTLSTH